MVFRKDLNQDELYFEMEKHLKMENNQPSSFNLVQAAEYLHSALEICEENKQLHSIADDILSCLAKIAAKKKLVKKPKKKEDKKEVPKTDRHTKGLTSKKEVANLLEHGTVFNMDKGDSDDHNLSKDQKEFVEWLKTTRKPEVFTKEHIDEDLRDLMDVEEFDLNRLDDENLLNAEVSNSDIDVNFDLEDPKDAPPVAPEEALKHLSFEDEVD